MVVVRGLAAAVAAVAVVGCSTVVRDPVALPVRLSAELLEIGNGLSVAPALRYRGSLTRDGERAQVDVTVLAPGVVSGTVAVGGHRAELLGAADRLFLRAAPPFWRATGMSAETAPLLDGHWGEVEPDFLGVDQLHTLAQAELGPWLHTQVRAQRAREDLAGSREDVRGQPAVRVRTDRGTVHVSVARPHRVVRIDHRAGSATSLALDVDYLGQRDSEALRAAMAASAGGLGNAYALRLGARIDLAVQVEFGTGATIRGTGLAPSDMRVTGGTVRASFYGEDKAGAVLDPPPTGVDPQLRFTELASCQTTLPRARPGERLHVECFATSAELTRFLLKPAQPSPPVPVPDAWVARMRGLAFGVDESTATALADDLREPLCERTPRSPLACTVSASRLPIRQPGLAEALADAINRAIQGQTVFRGDGATFDNSEGVLPAGPAYRSWVVDAPDGSAPGVRTVVIAGDPGELEAVYFRDSATGEYVRVV
ncbi:hypothetical protein [Actinophytocola sp. NPDC049390]|uniref:hypothetical protein n=1 Tax=Actinophytocola sp. NPDC049390 TaxID=3363894 RepID=UPI0037A14A96